MLFPDYLFQVKGFPALSARQRLISLVIEFHTNTVRLFIGNHLLNQINRFLGNMGCAYQKYLSPVNREYLDILRVNMVTIILFIYVIIVSCHKLRVRCFYCFSPEFMLGIFHYAFL